MAEIATDPLKEIPLDTKVDQLVKNSLPMGNIESILEVKKRYHIRGREADVQVYQAMVGTPLCQETIQPRK